MKKNFPLLLLLCMCLLVKAENNSAVIIEYLPAPGQFVNLLPAVGTDSAAAPIAAQQNIDRNNMITLGGFGGFVKMFSQCGYLTFIFIFIFFFMCFFYP